MKDTLEYQEAVTVVADHWVVSATLVPAGKIAECLNGGFVTGSMDKSIRVYSLDGTLVRTLVGHDHGVISLDWTASGELISGSWDGTAKVWDITDGTCVQTLPGHENGVNVLALPNGSIVTASTGRQEGDTVVDFKIRIWQDGSVVKILQPHTAAVRNLSLLPDIGFASCSNDGYSANMSCCCCEFCMYDLSILVLTHTFCLRMIDGWLPCLWGRSTVRTFTFQGDSLQTMQHSDGGFVYNVCTLTTGELVSVSEDTTLKVWKDGQCTQTIQNPRGMWCVTALPNGDFITGCQDSVVRLFTRTAGRVADADVQVTVGNPHRSPQPTSPPAHHPIPLHPLLPRLPPYY